MTRNYIVTKKEDLGGKIMVDVEVSESSLYNTKYSRDAIVKRITFLTQELSDLQKLLVDIDAKQLSITP